MLEDSLIFRPRVGMILSLFIYHDGPEALLLGNVHVVLHVTEDGRLHVQSRPVRSLAAQEESGAFLQSGLTVLHQLVQVSHVVLRAVLD